MKGYLFGTWRLHSWQSPLVIGFHNEIKVSPQTSSVHFSAVQPSDQFGLCLCSCFLKNVHMFVYVDLIINLFPALSLCLDRTPGRITLDFARRQPTHMCIYE